MTTLGSMEWLGGLADERRRRLRHALLGSIVAHVACVALLGLAPEPPPLLLPQAITVDLVAALPAPPAPPVSKPEPKALPAPAPPKPKVKILPKEAPTPVAKPKPKPKPEAKPEPKPEPVIRRRERPKELAYEDALAKLRGDLGEQAPAPPAPEPVARAEAPAAAASSGSRKGVLVAPELAAWTLAVMRHVRSNWIMPADFRDSGLAAQLEIEVAIDGRVIGTPKVVRSSGNPYFDDNAVRAVEKASPLPRAPKAGRRTLIFTAEE